MQNQIMRFQLDWHNCGLCFYKDIVQEQIVIERAANTLDIKEINGGQEVCSCKTIEITPNQAEKFFQFIENIAQKLAAHYEVDVYDGSAWILTLTDSDARTQEIRGTIYYPPYGKDIENLIRDFLHNSKETITPRMFGCSR